MHEVTFVKDFHFRIPWPISCHGLPWAQQLNTLLKDIVKLPKYTILQRWYFDQDFWVEEYQNHFDRIISELTNYVILLLWF